MKTCLVSAISDSLTYTVARALAYSGHEVVVWIANAHIDRNWDWSLSRHIAAIPGVALHEGDKQQAPSEVGRLVIQVSRKLLNEGAAIAKLAALAPTITLISYGDRRFTRGQAWGQQWREWRWARSWAARVDRVAYKDGFYGLDLWGLKKPRHVVGFDVHSKFLQDPTLFDAMHARDWSVDARRPTLVNFLGSRDPAIRERILDSVEHHFTQSAGSIQGQHSGKRMHWLAYTDAQPAALSAQQFLAALTESDFTLAPPGYSLVTHRPVEALLRGSIPVLNAGELDLYDLGLADGVNCIAVPPSGWPDAMKRITAMSESEIRRMRGQIQAMLPGKVSYDALARDISSRLGVAGA